MLLSVALDAKGKEKNSVDIRNTPPDSPSVSIKTLTSSEAVFSWSFE